MARHGALRLGGPHAVDAHEAEAAERALRPHHRRDLLVHAEPVLQVHHRRVRPEQGRQQAGERVVRGGLEADDDQIDRADLLRRRGGAHRKQGVFVIRIRHRDAALAQRREVAAREEGRVVAGLGHAPAVVEAERAGADDGDAHHDLASLSVADLVSFLGNARGISAAFAVSGADQFGRPKRRASARQGTATQPW